MNSVEWIEARAGRVTYRRRTARELLRLDELEDRVAPLLRERTALELEEAVLLLPPRRTAGPR